MLRFAQHDKLGKDFCRTVVEVERSAKLSPGFVTLGDASPDVTGIPFAEVNLQHQGLKVNLR
jgi:hypothetical protein